jgi:TRAP-type mannitol/chloroaromatic compound transport system permease small subunit
MFNAVNRLVSFINWITDLLGRCVSWLTVAMVVTVVAVVISRYFLRIGSIALQESVMYLHALVFLLGIGYTLRSDGHVRVDILYRRFSPRQKAFVDFSGGLLFLIPISVLIFYSSFSYVSASWAIREASTENNGLPYVYLLKTLMLVMPATLLLQGIAEILKSSLILISKSDVSERQDPNHAVNRHEPKI